MIRPASRSDAAVCTAFRRSLWDLEHPSDAAYGDALHAYYDAAFTASGRAWGFIAEDHGEITRVVLRTTETARPLYESIGFKPFATLALRTVIGAVA